jgi:hypothetical protein
MVGPIVLLVHTVFRLRCLHNLGLAYLTLAWNI